MTRATRPTATRTQPGSQNAAAWRLVAQLVRVEAPRLARHPATLLGLAAASGVAAWLFRDVLGLLARDMVWLALAGMPLAAGVFVAAHAAAARVDRDAAAPLVDPTPTPTAARTVALLVSLAGPMLLAAAWVAAAMAALAVEGGGTPHLGDVLALPLAVGLFGAAGVALGRWRASMATAGMVLVAAALALLAVSDVLTLPTSVGARLAPWADWAPRFGIVELWPRQPWLHAGYVTATAVVLGALALLRDTRGAGAAGVAVVAFAAAGALGWQLVGVWGDEDRLHAVASAHSDQALVRDCVEREGVEVCLPPSAAALTSDLAAHVHGALAQLPADQRPQAPRVEMIDTGIEELVATMPGDVGVQAAAAQFTVDWIDREADEPLLVAAGQLRGTQGAQQRWADLALEPIGRVAEVRSAVAAGEAGGARRCPASEPVAIALAADAMPDARAVLAELLDEQPRGWTEPDELDEPVWRDELTITGSLAAGADPAGGVTRDPETVPWTRGGAMLGLQLAEQGAAPELRAEWDDWTDPHVSRTELIDAFDLDPLPTPRELANDQGLDWDDTMRQQAEEACP